MKRWLSSNLRKCVILFLAVLLSAGIGAGKWLGGYDVHVSALFLVPVCWTGWMVGRRASLFVGFICAVFWLVACLTTGHTYGQPMIPYWNALMLLVLFVTASYALSAFQDVHQRLEMTKSLLENQNERLEEMVRRRTAALEAEIAERKRLEKARLQADRLAMVGTIAAQVAHEVRNPLGSITLNLDLIAKEIAKLRTADSDSANEANTLVHEMREEVHRIQRVIEDYLRFARLPKLRSQQLKLNDFLEQKLGFMEPTFKTAGIQLHTEFDARLNTISADAEQLWQAILNLVQNSLEAMRTGGTLAVTTRRENGQALLRVTDSGRGMNEDLLKQVFVPFFTTKPQGTGLGLSLTQRILNEHGAQIECSSVVGKGTTFTIRFPIAK
jgi:signal transduction histidine kinase